MNVVIIQGRLSRPAEERCLPSGDRLVQLDLTITRVGEKAESAPVVWFDAPASARELDVDEEVLVVGRVRRRFFRTPGGTQSRTEVVAEQVVLRRHTKKAAAAIDRALRVIEDEAAAPAGAS